MQTQQIIDTILGYYPDTQAIYLFDRMARNTTP